MPQDYETGRLYRVIASSAVAVPLTGTTAETVLATIPITKGHMGPNGMVRITTLWSYTNSVNAKTPRVRLGGLAGTVFQAIVATTTASLRAVCQIWARNSQASQVGFVAADAEGAGAETGALVTATVNMAANQDLVITGQLALGTETLTLEGYMVELLYGP